MSNVSLENDKTPVKGSNIDNQQQASNDFTKVQDSTNPEEFCKVLSRLSISRSTRMYTVTNAEIRRRLAGPESFNASLLGAYLRK